MWNHRPCFRFEIDNFSQEIKTRNNCSEQKHAIESQIFVSGGLEWYLQVYPRGDGLFGCDDHMSLYLSVGDDYFLQPRWKRSARFYFVVLNQADKELYISPVVYPTLCVEARGWGFRKTLPISKFEEEGFLENDKLIIEVYIDVDKEEAILDIKGFQVFVSQADSVRKIFAEHPEFAKDFKPKNKVVKTEYMNVLLDLIKTLEKPPKKISKSQRKKACKDLTELMEAGFKLDWLKSKLGLEVSLETTKESDPDVSRVQQLEERVKNLEQRESRFSEESSKLKLEEISLERNKANADWSRVSKLEESVFKLEWSHVSLDSLKARLEDVYEERQTLCDDVESQVKQLEKTVKNLELMVSNLTVELDKENAKSSADGFLLVDNVD